jgi:hypothetical protein
MRKGMRVSKDTEGKYYERKKGIINRKVNAQYPYHKKNQEKIKEIKLVKIERKCEIIVEYLSTSDAFIRSKRENFELIELTKVKILLI